MKRVKHILAIAALGLSSFAIGQNGEIHGTITDDSGFPLPGVVVYITQGAAKLQTMTDDKGKYKLKPLPNGKYTIRMSLITYRDLVIQAVDVSTDKITFAHGKLPFSNTLTGHIVRPKYEPWEPKLIDPDDTGADYIPAIDIKRNPLGQDVKKMITMLPGVTQVPGGTELTIRGARPINTQYVIEGVKLNNTNLTLPSSAIGKVKVYTSGVPAKYGDVTGGVIVLEMKSYFDLLQEARK